MNQADKILEKLGDNQSVFRNPNILKDLTLMFRIFSDANIPKLILNQMQSYLDSRARKIFEEHKSE